MKKYYFLLLFSLIVTTTFSQVGINTTNPEAQLDIKSSNQALPSNKDGLLIPKIDTFPAINPTAAQQGMLVYLNTTLGTNLPGFYYWNNSPASWLPLKGINGGTLDQAYDFGGAGLGKTITADAGAVLINGTDGFISTGTLAIGATPPTGFGVRMVWNPRKAAFRAGEASATIWDDVNIGVYSTAFGLNTQASGGISTAFGQATIASGFTSIAFGTSTTGSGNTSTAFGQATTASGDASTAFGSGTVASGFLSTAFGFLSTAIGANSTAFGYDNLAPSYGETVLGIGATNYTSSTNGATQFRTANATDRLFVIGNAIDLNNNSNVDNAERRDALIILKNGLTRLPSTTNAMITAADGKAVVTKEYLQSTASGTLDQAYDFGGAGLGKTITADAGAVLIDGTDGFVSTGTLNSGAIAPSGAGVKMFWNPRSAAFRAGRILGTQWDDLNIGNSSFAFGINTTASGFNSTAFGQYSTASSTVSTAFGQYSIASGYVSTAFGKYTNAIGDLSTAFGRANTASSFGETVLGIGATTYTPSINGDIGFRTANATDRLFVIGNAIDVDNDGYVDTAERSDAMIVLKSGLTRLPSTTSAMITAADGKAVVTKEYLEGNGWNTIGNSGTNPTNNFIGTTDNQSLAFRTNNLERMTVLNTGNVGIGTSTPDRKLEISAAGNVYGRITSDNNNFAGLELLRIGTGTSADWRIQDEFGQLVFSRSTNELASVLATLRLGSTSLSPGVNNTMALGGTTTRWTEVFATNGVINTSDRREKQEIEPLNYGLDKLMSLKPITFKWIDNKIDNSSKHLGFIAQDLQQIIPEVVIDHEWRQVNETAVWTEAERLGVNYAEVIPVLVKSIQEQQAIIEKQKEENNSLKNQLESQSKTINTILNRLEKLENK